MIENLIEEFREDINSLRDAVTAFENNTMDKKTYKGISGGFGSYAQSCSGHMLRLRTGGGRLTMPRLKMLTEVVEKYHIERLKLTTCQTIQLHDLSADDLPDIIEMALDSGIVTRGGGGDNPRNVMTDPLSGIQKEEYFDVMPCVEAVGDYLIRQMKQIHMPRKLKVAFCSSPSNQTHATFRDLGFIAREDGTFDVYCAGGLGPSYKMGVLAASGAKPENVLYYVRAMIDTFVENGNYQNRARARTRYLQDTLGVEGLQEAFTRHLKNAMDEGGLNIRITDNTIVKQPDGEAPNDPRVIPQKQKGLFAVSYHPIGGLLPSHMPRKLYDLTYCMEEVEWRIGPDETIYAINLTGREAQEVLLATSGGADTQFATSVSCIGAAVCQQGLRDTQKLLAAMLEAVKSRGYADGVLPRMNISGCPSSCGTHQIGTIGFQGAVKSIDGKAQPAYFVFLNGSAARGQENFGERIGTMLERDIPEFVLALGDAVSKENSTFACWYPAHQEQFEQIAAKYLC